MFLDIQIDLIILQTYDQQFTLTSKKSLQIIFKAGGTDDVCEWWLISTSAFDH